MKVLKNLEFDTLYFALQLALFTISNTFLKNYVWAQLEIKLLLLCQRLNFFAFFYYITIKFHVLMLLLLNYIP